MKGKTKKFQCPKCEVIVVTDIVDHIPICAKCSGKLEMEEIKDV